MNNLNKDKILIHSNYFPGNSGGIEFVVKSILKCLPLNLYDIKCFYGGVNSANYSDGGINFYSRKIFFKFGGACLLSFGNLYFIIAGIKSNLIILQEPYPTLWPAVLILRRLFKKKIIVLVHANPVSKRWIMNAYNKMRSFVFSGSVCVATSPNLLKQVNSTSFYKSMMIPLSISSKVSFFSPSLELPNRYALYIGRLAGYKGLLYLMDSISKCPEVNFVIAGDGPIAQDIYKLIEEKKLSNVIFINRFVTEDEKLELISRSEFFIFPSISENEAFGLVQLEAMRLMKPIINTYLDSGVNYVAPNEVCAVTVERCNSIALSVAIKELWLNSDYSRRLGVNGLKRFSDNFTDDKFVKSWQDLIASQLDDGN